MDRPMMGERSRRAAAPVGHRRAERQPRPSPAESPGAAPGRETRTDAGVLGKRQCSPNAAVSAKTSWGCGARSQLGAGGKPHLRPALADRRSGAQGAGGRGWWRVEHEQPRFPVPAFCSREQASPGSTGNGRAGSADLPGSPRSGKNEYGLISPARCPAAALPVRGAAPPDRGASGAEASGCRSSPLPRPPPAPAPELTVLVVFEVVVGTGPAAALGRVLHVVELQKVRPLAREAQEGGGQAPRQGHQPPGAGERAG